METGTRGRSAMIEALEADGPYPEYAEKLMLFGRLVGSWAIEGRFFDERGNVIRSSTGEWHRRLIEARRYVLDSDWGEVQPKADEENAEWRHKDVELAAHALLQKLDRKPGLTARSTTTRSDSRSSRR